MQFLRLSRDFLRRNIIKTFVKMDSNYHSVDGSAYSLKIKIAASDKIIQMEIEIVKNDAGYGIYNLDIDFD